MICSIQRSCDGEGGREGLETAKHGAMKKMSNKILSKDIRKAIADIKAAILQSQYRVAQAANVEMLSLYYGIGRYVSENTRTNA